MLFYNVLVTNIIFSESFRAICFFLFFQIDLNSGVGVNNSKNAMNPCSKAKGLHNIDEEDAEEKPKVFHTNSDRTTWSYDEQKYEDEIVCCYTSNESTQPIK